MIILDHQPHISSKTPKKELFQKTSLSSPRLWPGIPRVIILWSLRTMVPWFKLLPPVSLYNEDNFNTAAYKIYFYSFSWPCYLNHTYPLSPRLLRVLIRSLLFSFSFISNCSYPCDIGNHSTIRDRKISPGLLVTTSSLPFGTVN